MEGHPRRPFFAVLCGEPGAEVFPFVLTTGRLYSHWHTLTRTAKNAKLVRREPGPFVELHPGDADRLQVTEGSLVQISSRRGTGLCFGLE